jgi:ribosomal protein S18 acetylase RimI-like enzyme
VDGIELRLCAPGDELALSLLGQATFLEAFAGILDGRDILAHCRNQHAANIYRGWLNSPSNSIYVAETLVGRAPVGYAVVDNATLPIADPKDTDLEMKRIYLLHRFQGRGIGRALMDQAVAAAKERARKRLLLGVYGRNAQAIAFYRRNGFEQIGERRFQVGDTLHEDAIMARNV